ncbi:FadR family transcriptional regulator [Cryobacterium sp. TMT1-3]|uniref:FadR family transcriptional regulator n=1 Tax=Cryobacterium luteum TaxID=1424661 RepID=A0A1H8KTT5_9MICO|nr:MULTISPECIES: FCD domain-containing protein [Cryobacterium]TFB87810.1 FadR family transcriptional regulator [Cryobacterium luteum]TFC30578.1 FadR family transcriptional regulator [Cryobacterium sp. TMT1-3]SEN95808.1 transcriptional regulator, GntR family [Cryobacterium luteum]
MSRQSSAGPPTAGLSSDLLLGPVSGTNTFEETVQRLLQTVRLGLIAPGERLPAERELAAQLGVSRDTLREAIASLAGAGYLISRRGRYGGTFVSNVLPAPPLLAEKNPTGASHPSITAAQIDDVLTLRDILEVGGARAAAGRVLSPPERELLWSSLEAAAAADADEYRRVDSRLHLYIGELAGSPSLVPLLADVRMRLNELLDAIPLLAPNIAHSNKQHEQIVIAILTGRPDAATDAMREHLSGTALLLRGFLE